MKVANKGLIRFDIILVGIVGYLVGIHAGRGYLNRPTEVDIVVAKMV